MAKFGKKVLGWITVGISAFLALWLAEIMKIKSGIDKNSRDTRYWKEQNEKVMEQMRRDYGQ